MKTLTMIFDEIWGLFVDDGSLAILIVVWCLVAGLVFAYINISIEFRGPLLFVGLVIILIENIWRTSKAR